MHSDGRTVIRELSLFSSLSDDLFDDLIRTAYLQDFPAHVQLTREGEPATFLHVLLSGRVELFGRANERETTMFLVRPPSTFNLSSVLEESNYLLSARTMDNASILMIPSRDVRKVIAADSGFANAMISEIAGRYRKIIRVFKGHRLRSGPQRLASYLLQAHRQTPEAGKIELTEDKRTIAALLGMTPEYLSRAFNALKVHGVRVSGKSIELTDIESLQNFARPYRLEDRRSGFMTSDG